MLVIKRINGKVMYAFDGKQKHNKIETIECYPVPIQQRDRTLFLPDTWYNRHQCDIEYIIDLYFVKLYEFIKLNSRFTCIVNEQQLRETLFQKIYKSSYSKSKTFP
jgi:hypothetical protein